MRGAAGRRSRTAGRTSLGHLEGAGRRAEPDVQRAHGHLLLRPRAVAARRSRLPAAAPSMRDGRICGLGISNMKGALACYVEAVRALQRRRRPPARRRPDRRGRAVRSRRRSGARTSPAPSTAATRPAAATCRRTAAVADMCILGEPTEQQDRARPLRHDVGCASRRAGPFIHTAFSAGRAGRELDRADAAGARRRARLDPDRGSDRSAYGGIDGVVNVGCDRARVRLARQPHPAPHRPLPRHPRPADDGDDGRPR